MPLATARPQALTALPLHQPALPLPTLTSGPSKAKDRGSWACRAVTRPNTRVRNKAFISRALCSRSPAGGSPGALDKAVQAPHKAALYIPQVLAPEHLAQTIPLPAGIEAKWDLMSGD